MRTGKRSIDWGEQFDNLFSRAKGQFIDVKKYAVLNDTLGLMKEVISTTLDDTKKLAQTLKASTPKETCRNVWNFCFHHIQYEKDETNIEQVRRPARAWKDRIRGIDCDCLTVFIGSVLTNLGIPFLIRITKYNWNNDYEHVYPVALIGNETIIMDAVVHQFNYEVPYTEKRDISMKLQYLNGFEDDEEDDFEAHDEDENDQFDGIDVPEDAEALFLFDDEDLEGLDGKAKRQEKKAARKEKRAEKKEERKENKPTLKDRLKKGLNVVNKLNPVTALLRAGILAAMKLNVGKAAAKLRYSYWTEAQATAGQMEPGKWKQLQDVRKKLESIFYGAGGKIANLKKAVLTGKGNKDKKIALNGLSAVIQPVSDYQDLQTIIGSDTFYEEFDEVKASGVHGLGEPISAAAALAAASGVIATIVGLIKKVGSLFKKGSPQEQQEILSDNTTDEEEKTREFSIKNIANKVQQLPKLPQVIATKYAPIIAQGAAILNEESISKNGKEIDDDEETTEAAELDLSELETGDKNTLPAVAKEAEPPASNAGTTEIAKSDNMAPAASKDATPKADTKPGVMQWVKDHPYITVGIAVVTIGGAIMAYKAYQAAQAKKAQEAKRNLSGVPVKGTGKRTKSKTVSGGIRKVKLL